VGLATAADAQPFAGGLSATINERVDGNLNRVPPGFRTGTHER
jgi:hypothetical protein